ncbi:MAG: hypothetical protein GXP45_00495 [bacterium]|nr:hypothetical protein [bacterium]
MGEYQILGQLRNSYIILQSNDALFYIDQHALAERVAFEQMKNDLDKHQNYQNIHALKPEKLLQAISIDISYSPQINEQIAQLNKLGFDCNLLGENKIIVYAVPQIFIKYKVDLETLFEQIRHMEEINFDHILDKIFASKACKASIKAGQKLSYEQIQQLLQDGFQYIPGMFVCQHGRPFFIQIDKSDIDKLFDR